MAPGDGGLLGVLGVPTSRQEGEDYTQCCEGSQSLRGAPSAGLEGSGATPVRQDTTEATVSTRERRLCRKAPEPGNKATLALLRGEIGHNDEERVKKKRKKREKRKKENSVKLLQVPSSKNICRGREDRLGGGGWNSERKRQTGLLQL